MIDYVLHAANYDGVTLLDSPFKRQRDETLALYLEHPSTGDILHRTRLKAGIPSSARGMTGWGPSIGQYLGAYAKLWRGTGDERAREKCLEVFRGWAECVDVCEDCLDYGTYPYEKLLGGLMDMVEYMGVSEAADYARRLTQRAMCNFDPDIPRDGCQDDRMKGQIEWYTLPENLYRAWQLTGDTLYRDYAEVWLYPWLWDHLAVGDFRIGPRHAYSHVNSLSSAARAYVVTGDRHYLEVIENAYTGILAHHTYITGGYGPAETLFGESEGYLGDALLSTWDNQLVRQNAVVYRNFADMRVARSDAWGSCEVSCCAWAVFKLCNYLLQLTGEAKYGDWVERMLVNGTLGQPPVTPKGQILYYASYFQDGALKSYEDRRLQHMGQNFVWQCCTGTFPQDVAEYANMIAYYDEAGVSVSQLIPAEIRFLHDGREVTLISDGDFPNKPEARLTLRMEAPTRLRVRLRVPAWADGDNAVSLNGEALDVPCRPNTWLSLERNFNDGDTLYISMAARLRFTPVDPQHPNLVALSYGPLVLACDEMTVLVGDVERPEDWIVPVPGEDNVFETLPGHAGIYEFVTRRFRPYWTIGTMQWYYMYNRIYPTMEDLDRYHQGF